MTSARILRLAAAQTPVVPTRLHPGTPRWHVLSPLPEAGCIGIELGVAAGSFAVRMVQSGQFRRVFGVDAYADGHSVREYKAALRAIGFDADYRLLRMTFDQALDLFAPESFDFIYCDGYAHTGEEGGATLLDWYAKLRPGGVMAGDDYDAGAWPLVVWAVNHLVAQIGAELQLTDLTSEAAYNRYRSWYFVKPVGGPAPVASAELAAVGAAERARVHKARQGKRQARRAKDTPAPES